MGESATDLQCRRAARALVQRHTGILTRVTAIAARRAAVRLAGATTMLDHIATRRIRWIDDATTASEPAGLLPAVPIEVARPPRVVPAGTGQPGVDRVAAGRAVASAAIPAGPRGVAVLARTSGPPSDGTAGRLVARPARPAAAPVRETSTTGTGSRAATQAAAERSRHGDGAAGPSLSHSLAPLAPLPAPPLPPASQGALPRGGSNAHSGEGTRLMRTRPGAAPVPSRPTPITASSEDARRALVARSTVASRRSDPPGVAAAGPPERPALHRGVTPFAHAAGHRSVAPSSVPSSPTTLLSPSLSPTEAMADPARAEGRRQEVAADRRIVDGAPTALTAADVSAMIERALADLLHDFEIDGERLGRSSWR